MVLCVVVDETGATGGVCGGRARILGVATDPETFLGSGAADAERGRAAVEGAFGGGLAVLREAGGSLTGGLPEGVAMKRQRVLFLAAYQYVAEEKDQYTQELISARSNWCVPVSWAFLRDILAKGEGQGGS